MRLFTAINFNIQTRAKLLAMRNELRSRSARGNFSAPENLHLTLAFIGECSQKQAEKVKMILDTVDYKPFAVSVERLGAFSHGTLWWAGLRQDKGLMDIQHEIAYKLALCGFVIDGREYHPHITLGRQIMTDASPRRIEPFGETVTSIDLMKSERIDGKLTYTSIYERQAGDV